LMLCVTGAERQWAEQYPPGYRARREREQNRAPAKRSNLSQPRWLVLTHCEAAELRTPRVLPKSLPSNEKSALVVRSS
jgi:hypothetical protein